MADEFDDLRDYLHRSGIGTAEATPATTQAGERALVGILARRGHSTRRRLVAVGSVAAAVLVGSVLVGLPPADAPVLPPAGPVLAALPVVPDDQAAPWILDQAVPLYSASPDPARAWYIWDSDAPPILTTVRPGQGGTVLVVQQDAAPPGPDGRIRPAPSGAAPEGRSSTIDAGGAPTTSLASILAAPCSYDTIACALEAITDLRTSAAPRAVISDAVLWQALAAREGLAVPGRTTDRLGREVAVVSADSRDGRHRIALLIDPASGRYVGTEYMTIDGPAVATVRFVAVV